MVSTPMLEVPILVSSTGTAVTSLNWSDAPLKDVNMEVALPFKTASVTSAEHGTIPYTTTSGGIKFRPDVDAADIVAIKP
jgi:hypothetical protein